jgi:hypothetical protein
MINNPVTERGMAAETHNMIAVRKIPRALKPSLVRPSGHGKIEDRTRTKREAQITR